MKTEESPELQEYRKDFTLWDDRIWAPSDTCSISIEKNLPSYVGNRKAVEKLASSLGFRKWKKNPEVEAASKTDDYVKPGTTLDLGLSPGYVPTKP